MAELDRFHDGERYVQERVGARKAALRNGTLIGDAIPPRAIPFLAQQRMLAVGSVDEQGTVSASLLIGERGLASSPDGRSVVIDPTLIEAIDADAFWSNLHVGVDVGLLAIELSSRRRLRINGVVSCTDAGQVVVSVREAYPNCPEYIQRRHLSEDRDTPPASMQPRASGVALDEVRAALVERCDTLFVASRHPTRGVDVSHRGGEPGFVRVLEPSCLRIPDYRGNGVFNTLGNFVVDNRAGLAFLDFDRGSILQMTGTVAVHLDAAEDPRHPTGGTGRYWDFRVARWLELPVVSCLTWELLDYSPHNPSALK